MARVACYLTGITENRSIQTTSINPRTAHICITTGNQRIFHLFRNTAVTIFASISIE